MIIFPTIGYGRPLIVLPWVVLQELDYIKDNKKHGRYVSNHSVYIYLHRQFCCFALCSLLFAAAWHLGRRSGHSPLCLMKILQRFYILSCELLLFVKIF